MRMPPRLRRRLAVSFAVSALWFGAAWAPALAATPNDPRWSQQWAPARIGAPEAWETSRALGITIGIVDSGIDRDHEDLMAKIKATAACSAGQCAAAGDASDIDGQGTHVAGIAAASTDNNLGIAGVAPGARLLVAKALDEQAGALGGDVADINAGIRWVVDQGAKVVNLSLGGNLLITNTSGASLRDGIQYAWGKGAVVVLAAGNAEALGFPSASYGDLPAIVVAATGPDDEVSPESAPTGTAKWAIAAPGGNTRNSNPSHDDPFDLEIMSTFPDPAYALKEGTSMAAPHVAGTVALVLARPGITARRAVDIVLDTANGSVGCGSNSPTCAGRVDAAAAVASTRAPGTTTTTTAPNTTTTSVAGTATTTTAPVQQSTTTEMTQESTTTTAAAISVPEPAERSTTTTAPEDGDELAASGGGDGGGLGPIGALATVALLGSAVWAAVVARREGLGDLAVVPFLARGDGSDAAGETGPPPDDR